MCDPHRPRPPHPPAGGVAEGGRGGPLFRRRESHPQRTTHRPNIAATAIDARPLQKRTLDRLRKGLASCPLPVSSLLIFPLPIFSSRGRPAELAIVKWRLLLLLLRKKWCSSFVRNSQGAVFYSHWSEWLWFADCHHIFYFSQKKRHVKKRKKGN